MKEKKLTRYLVRRKTKEVFIWTELLAKGHPDLEDVVAENVQDAIARRALPDPRQVSLAELESMNKRDLILFAQLKLKNEAGEPLELDASKSVKELLLEVKQAIFNRPLDADAGPEDVVVDMRNAKPGQAVTHTTSSASPREARTRRGA